jgi:hypothetical protein
MVWMDGDGRSLELIRLRRGPHDIRWWILATWHGYLLGPGHPGGPGRGWYRTVEEALCHVDATSLVEVLRFRPRSTPFRPEPYLPR